MDAITAEHKRSQPRVTRVGKEDKAGRRKRQRAEDEEEAGDEVDAFMQQRDRISLNPEDDDREEDMDDQDDRNARVLDLPDEEAAEDEDDDEEDDGEELDEDELYAEEPEDAFRPLSVDDILGEDDEQRRQRSLREEERLTTAWGRNKRLYYSADTAEFELESDEEVAKEEEQEADRLMKKQLAQRSESDYTLAELMALNAATPTAGTEAAAGGARKGKGKQVKSDVVSLFDELGEEDGTQQVEQVERVDAMSEREKLKAITARAPELVGLMEEMKERVAEVEEERQRPLDAGVDKVERERRTKCMEALELALTMYVSAGVMYLALRAEGRQLDSHPINQQLMNARAQLTRLLSVKDVFTGRLLRQVKQSGRQTEAVDDVETEEAEQQQGGDEEKDAGEGMDEVDDDEADGDEFVDEDDSDFADDQREAPKRTVPTTRVDIFSSLKPAIKATKSSSHILTAPRPSAHNLFAGLEDDADTLAQPMGKKQKVKATIVPTSTTAADDWKSSVDNFDDDEDEDDLFGSVSRGAVDGAAEGEEDEDGLDLYNQLQAQQQKRKQLEKQLKQARSQPATSTSTRPSSSSHTLLPASQRPITSLMDRNEGLKPSRPKDRKTPKTRNRARYEKAMVKRRSQVREYQGQGGVYGGEATGIRRNVAKSVRLKG